MDGAAHTYSDPSDLPPPPPPRLHERLHLIPDYTWDESELPFHSSYDFWHVIGTRTVPEGSSQASPYSISSTGPANARGASGKSLPSEQSSYLAVKDHSDGNATPTPTSQSTLNSRSQESQVSTLVEQRVVARISYHPVREERCFQIAKSLIATTDPDGDHIVQPVDLIRLAPVPGDRAAIIVAIYVDPGHNLLFDVLDLGPAFYKAEKVEDAYEVKLKSKVKLKEPISLHHFLDFAIGSAQCLEILHHGKGMIHGEIRGDAFHYNAEEAKVRIVAFGSGVRSFEHGLTSTGWSTLSKEIGAKNKLLYISPEQTGRMPAEPDSRTDIYSLGVLFWSLLAQRPVYSGDSPLDIVQNVLTRRIPDISTVRMDIPDAIGRIIQRCAAKSVADRYHSASGLRYDLVQVQQLLEGGDMLALKDWQAGTKDVSSFFMLPVNMIGREREKADLIRIIERVAKTYKNNWSAAANPSSDASSLSQDTQTLDEMSSEGTSSIDGNSQRPESLIHRMSPDNKQSNETYPLRSSLAETGTLSNDTASSNHSTHNARPPRPWERQHSMSMDGGSMSLDISLEGSSRQNTTDGSSPSLSRRLGTAKYRRRGRTEVVLIEGAGGLGKSFLVSNVLTEARRQGYCATAKFDTARRTAFGPLLKLLSSLFKQVWGERNTETAFHQGLKQYVRPVWPMLHRVLGLPEFLLGPPEVSVARTFSSSYGPASRNSLPPTRKRRGSSPSNSPTPASRARSIPTSSTSQDFLRSGTSAKTVRLLNTFLDVLRVFTAHKFICFCLDDLHFADEESLELISQIILSRMNMVIIITLRPEYMTQEKLQNTLEPPELHDFPRVKRPLVTRIPIVPLLEGEIVKYVAATMCRPEYEVISLALIIQSKTAGNPFYIREMLSTCHRNRCIWYDYRFNQWHFDLDRLFEQFQGGEDFDVLDEAFITRRLDELPDASRTILAWAALWGNSFSFDFICLLMEEQESFGTKASKDEPLSIRRRRYSHGELVSGLQAAVSAYIIVQSDTDDRFHFAHDRYSHAASTFQDCDSTMMHFVVAQTLLKHYSNDDTQRENTAMHICKSVKMIKEHVTHRRSHRQLILYCAQTASEGSARPTAAKYYGFAIELLQSDPWNEEQEDVSYDETMNLYLRLAECLLYMGQHSATAELLSTIFAKARAGIDKAPAYVLRSRMYSENGDSDAALNTLKECLGDMNVDLEEHPTYATCDRRFERLANQIKSMETSQITQCKQPLDPTIASVGAVLAETIAAAWWSDCVRFYHLTLVMTEMHLSHGSFPQSGLAFLYLGTIALSRFSLIAYARDLGNICQELLQSSNDLFSLARGLSLYPLYIGHIHLPLSACLDQVEDAIEHAAATGDRTSSILSYGFSALMKFYAGENLSNIEALCQYGCEEIPKWYVDTRGGVLILGVRQLCRALQGRTNTHDPEGTMSDDQHDSATYKTWINSMTRHSNRSALLYESLEIVPLFLYGHYDQAIEVGRRCMAQLGLLWSARNSRLLMLYHGISLTGSLLRRMQDPRSTTTSFTADKDQVLTELREILKQLKEWAVLSDINYTAWIKLIEGQIAEVSEEFGEVVRYYEEALDHAAEHHFVLEEALGNYLMAGFFLRRKARRAARAALLDAVGFFRRVGATGVASAIEDEHNLLLNEPTRNHWTADQGVQTDFIADAAQVQYRAMDGDDPAELTQVPDTVLTQSQGDRTAAWRGSMQLQNGNGAGLPALDMIDLHAILVSSQVISSMLNVDELLKTMCDVILQTCGGSATLAAIVVQDTNAGESWAMAASGDPERGAVAHNPMVPLAGTALIAENVVLYCTRFLESAFIPNLIFDERFGNVSDSWLQKNPLGKAIIALPIRYGNDALLGVLYLEGRPSSFTDRNMIVLQLLVNQIGISYSNALAMKNVEKISAENRSMVTLQKHALAKAIESETKAKNAEAEAKKNVKLAEEAAKAKSIFLANVSHELRTPLNGVIGNSELLRDSQLSKEQIEMADSIKVSAELLLTVINDILDFSKMEADKMKLYIIAFNPEEMVREVVRAVSYSNREKTSKKNVKIIHDINLPSRLVYGDPIRLHQVLGNLIANSLKFTEDGSITIGARLENETKDTAELNFWVRDTGIGISPQQVAKLFRPFSQADASTARKYGGSGLGLSICKSLIELMMHGQIHLESEERVGTTAWFKVTFDKANADASAGDVPSLDASQSLQANEPPAQGGLSMDRTVSPSPHLDLSVIPKEEIRICVAEDNPINQKIAIQYVQRLGFANVSAYENGEKAVEGLREMARRGEPYHIVLMDVQMPLLDGYEATKQIRQDPMESVRNVLVIAMTASAIQGDREKCLAAGMNDYLAKPVRSETLKKKLDTYLNPVESTLNIAKTEKSNTSSIGDAASVKSNKDFGQTITRKPLPRFETAVKHTGEENAFFERPVDYDPSQQPKASPPLSDGISPLQVMPPFGEGNLIPHHRPAAISSDISKARSGNAGPASEASVALPQKRQPRKLQKSRGSGESGADVIESGDSVAGSETALPERARGLLQKRPPNPP